MQVCDDILETVANVNWDDIAGMQPRDCQSECLEAPVRCGMRRCCFGTNRHLYRPTASKADDTGTGGVADEESRSVCWGTNASQGPFAVWPTWNRCVCTTCVFVHLQALWNCDRVD